VIRTMGGTGSFHGSSPVGVVTKMQQTGGRSSAA
jgi:hypothetical protein